MKAVSQKEFLAAYDAYADALYRFAVVQALDTEHARDAVQEAFVRTWKYMAAGNVVDSLRPFLYRTVRNILIDESRRTPTESLEALQEDGYDAPDPRADVAAVRTEATLTLSHMARLEQNDRELILMRFIDDLGPSEIAQITGMSENVVSVHLHRAIRKLKILMHIP